MSRFQKKFHKAVKEVADTLMAMSDEEFAAELEKHKDGDITRILQEESRRWEEYQQYNERVCIDKIHDAC